jgi:hypothetical protein
MKIPHDTPQDIRVDIAEHQILLNFNDDEGALAFSDWWSYEGGSELFAQWVQNMQIKEGRYPNLTIEESDVVSWDEGEEDDSDAET